jgi:hypothetical protein
VLAGSTDVIGWCAMIAFRTGKNRGFQKPIGE